MTKADDCHEGKVGSGEGESTLSEDIYQALTMCWQCSMIEMQNRWETKPLPSWISHLLEKANIKHSISRARVLKMKHALGQESFWGCLAWGRGSWEGLSEMWCPHWDVKNISEGVQPREGARACKQRQGMLHSLGQGGFDKWECHLLALGSEREAAG